MDGTRHDERASGPGECRSAGRASYQPDRDKALSTSDHATETSEGLTIAIQTSGLILRGVFRASEHRQTADGAKGTHQKIRPPTAETFTIEGGKRARPPANETKRQDGPGVG